VSVMACLQQSLGNGARTGDNDDMRFRAVAMSVVVLLAVRFSSRAQDKTQSERTCFVAGNDLADPAAPTFKQYAAGHPPPFSPAPLNLESNPIARRYRTVIREEMKHGPNYAGHYRVVFWGCGTSCSQFAVVNLKTGHVITLKGIYSVAYVDFVTDDFLPETDSEGYGFRFKKESNLLVLVGTLVAEHSPKGGFEQGASYYLLKDEELQFVHRTSVTHRTCQKE
jgi:hypothetical protein